MSDTAKDLFTLSNKVRINKHQLQVLRNVYIKKINGHIMTHLYRLHEDGSKINIHEINKAVSELEERKMIICRLTAPSFKMIIYPTKKGEQIIHNALNNKKQQMILECNII
ncbi:hypothetical protein [Commensalibacter papalotli (ex Botero et al. 2024)]|uniref:hypothetical protein n=1 Tax=Commensalibacter papalotli (ex Botero et al. 2024) TaxID=2972766 RepID=UPI0022FFC367|nr:hypothetical protein [Commensalibacter papalotli (ex Botero et al. 2024)]CAI3958263.1 unnamed protein product [Commensalibacter papalotli (ex Botero et al. 2024)]